MELHFLSELGFELYAYTSTGQRTTKLRFTATLISMVIVLGFLNQSVFGFLLDNFKVLISALVVICFLFILFSSYYFWDFTLMAKVENT